MSEQRTTSKASTSPAAANGATANGAKANGAATNGATAKPAAAARPAAKAAPANGAASAASATAPAKKPAARPAAAATQAATNQAATAQAAAIAAEQPAATADELLDDAPISARMWVVYGVSCAASTLTHMFLLIILGLVVTSGLPKESARELIATVEERPPEQLNQVLEQDTTPSKTLDQTSASAQAIGAMGVMSVSVAPQFKQDDSAPVPDQIKADPGELNVFNTTGRTFSKDVPQGTLGEAMAQAGSYADAMDRITAEILTKLTKGKTLVVWVFDQSESMLDDRQEIMKRIERIYTELGIADKAAGDAVLTAVTSYGADQRLHTQKPTSDVAQIISAMKSVPVDPSGQEMMCEAISYAVLHHLKFATSGRRQIMTIVVTDESGDPDSNYKYMEQTIVDCKQARCPVYFLGREAVFGYPYAHMIWTDPATQSRHWVRIDRGPETPYAELLQVDGYKKRHDAHPSGFGPYVQTRIARQTGGIFFMLPSPESNLVRRDDKKYEFESMRAYLPDLSARDVYAAERDKSEFRKKIWKTILDFNPYEKDKESVVQVRWDNWAITEPEFVAQCKEEHARAQRLIGYFQTAQKDLEKFKAARDREQSFRWRANYDLMYAQLVADQVRLHEFCAMVEEKAKKFVPPKDKKSNEWHLRPIAKTRTDAKTKPQRDVAIELFKAVMKEHPGTPYAWRADGEIKQGFGCDLIEHYQVQGVKRPNL